MHSQITAWLAIFSGLIGLTLSADRFVHYAVLIAKRAQLSTFFIGMTIVAIGTSAPEIMVSIIAASTGNPKLAIGNAIGSNIANTTLVLGATILIAPILVKTHILKKEMPLLLSVTLLVGLLIFDLELNLADAGILLAFATGLALFVCYQHFKSKAWPEPSPSEELDDTPPETLSLEKTFVGFGITLVLLLTFSRTLVWGGVEVAQYWNVSDTLIGLTIIAVGTSLPELAASIASALKKHHGLALGNVIGSNVMNILLVLPWPGLIAPTLVEAEIFQRDYIFLLLITLGLAACIYYPFYFQQHKTERLPENNDLTLGRIPGGLLFIAYIGYIGYLISGYLTNTPPV